MNKYKRHINIFICSMSSGGAEHQVAILSNLLVDRGYRVTITTFGDNDDHYSLNSEIRRVRLAEGKSKIIKLFTILWYFLTITTDVVISFGQRENFLSLIPLCFRRIRVIAGERSLSIGKQSLRTKFLHKVLYRRVNVVVSNSYSQRDYLVSSIPQLASKVITITNYTDLQHFAYRIPPCNDIIRIGIFGRYNIAKNYERLIQVVGVLKQNGYSQFRIDCYGNHHLRGGQMNEDYLKYKDLVKKMGVGDIIYLNDHVRNVAEKISMFDIICLPSLWEGWSNAISEAICSGKPMLVSNVSDNSRMVHNGVNGFLFDPKSIDDMVGAFEKMFALDKDTIEAMGRESRKLAEKLFDKEQFITKYIQLIENSYE